MFRKFGFATSLMFLISFTVHAEKGVDIDVKLTPAGGYIAKAKVTSGTARKTADGVAAENIVVDLKSISTGISLRDKHTKERLLVDKHPQAKLVKAEGKDGKGIATIDIRGQQLDVNGTYEIKGGNLVAKFPISLKDLSITDVRYMGVGVKDTVHVTVEVPLSESAANPDAAKKKAAGKKK